MYLEALELPQVTPKLKHKINRRRADDDALSEFLEAMWDQRQRKLRFEAQGLAATESGASETKEQAQLAVSFLMQNPHGGAPAMTPAALSKWPRKTDNPDAPEPPI